MVGFRLDTLPDPQPIFKLIQDLGRVPESEMYRVFKMGIRFCLIVPDDPKVFRAVEETFAAHRFDTHLIGRVVADEKRRVFLPKENLIGEGVEFRYG